MKGYHYDVFSRFPNKGNPAGVVLNADDLSQDEMQIIARKVGFNETAFVTESKVADKRIRYFTPGHEMNLCGHGTIAAIYALYDQLGIKNIKLIETKAGILNTVILSDAEGRIQVGMGQAPPEFRPFHGDEIELCQALKIDFSDLDHQYPIMYGSTGIWTLLVPVKNQKIIEKMEPNNQRFPTILSELPHASVHPFTFDVYDKTSHILARHFSSPYSGTIEDPVTGTASGVLGAYYLEVVKAEEHLSQVNLVVEQGHQLNREGQVFVEVTKSSSQIEVRIAGHCAYKQTLEI